MSILSKRKVRFAADYRQVFATSGLVDVYTGQVIETVRGNATRFEIGFFEGATPLDLDDVESINLKIQPSQTTDGVLADQTIVSWDLTLTAETWADGTQQHAVFELSNAEMNIDPGGAARGLWLVVTAIMLSGDEVTLAAGTLNLHEDNNGSLAEPPESPGAYLTVDQGDVRYVGYNPQERSATAQWQARNNIAANGLVHTQEHLYVYDPTADVGLVLTRLPATNEASAEPYLSDYDLPTWKGFFGVYAYLVYARAEIDGKTNVWCLHDPWNAEHPYIADGSYDCRSTLPWDLVFDLKWDGEALVTLPTTGTATPQDGVQGADPRLFDERIPTAEGMVDKINATEDASAADTDRLAVVVAGALRWMSLSTLWTWIKAKIDLGQTWAGVHAFSSTTRPTSAGTGTPGVNSLITEADMRERYVADMANVYVRQQMGWDAGPWVTVGASPSYVADGNSIAGTRLIGSTGLAAASAQGGGIKYPDGGATGGTMATLTRAWQMRFLFRNGFSSGGGNAFFVSLRNNADFWSNSSIGLYHVPQPPNAWQAGTTYISGDRVNVAGIVHVVSTGGTSGGSAPSWNTTRNGTTNDNTVTWRNLGPHTSNNWALGFVDASGNISLTDTGVAWVTGASNTTLLSLRSDGSSVFASVNGSAEVSVARGALFAATPYVMGRGDSNVVHRVHGLLFTLTAASQ